MVPPDLKPYIFHTALLSMALVPPSRDATPEDDAQSPLQQQNCSGLLSAKATFKFQLLQAYWASHFFGTAC